MIAIPAIDIRDGCCVQLVGGSFEHERVRIADPLAVLDHWSTIGFETVHVVDLNAAIGCGGGGGNRSLIEALIASATCAVQVGGGVRTTEHVDALFAMGAHHVIVGTRAIEDREWLETIVARHPDRLIVAADVRGRDIVTRGWTATAPVPVLDLIEQLGAYPLAGVLVTAVHAEGRLGGPDTALMTTVVEHAQVPVIAAGGTSTMDDLHALSSCGVAAVVIGMALYTGALDASTVVNEFFLGGF
jgi:phosphoribosylformimino-5-aminoimidazole carboxamide ribotide isomerase